MQRIAGEHIVGPDGTITLGQYGSVPVVGMTLDEIRLTIADHLSEYFANPQVSVSVFAYNSKAYYIVTQGGGLGDGLVRLPYTGNETVLDALSQINGLSYVSSSDMWLARPNRQCGTSLQLPIDWQAITQRADVGTNYQLLPGIVCISPRIDWCGLIPASRGLRHPLNGSSASPCWARERSGGCRAMCSEQSLRVLEPLNERDLQTTRFRPTLGTKPCSHLPSHRTEQRCSCGRWVPLYCCAAAVISSVGSVARGITAATCRGMIPPA